MFGPKLAIVEYFFKKKKKNQRNSKQRQKMLGKKFKKNS